jgi:peptidylprolyl isomerase
MEHAIPTKRLVPHVLLAACAAFLAAAGPAAAADPPPAEPPPEAERNPYGLATIRLAEGFGEEHPDDNDYVGFHFTVWTSAGVQFQSTGDGQPVASLMEKISPAWREGLKLMVRGEKRRLWIPEHLAPKSAEAPKGDVICDLELTGLRKVPDLAAADLTPPADAERTPFGAYSRRLEKGTGTETAEAAEGVVAHFTLYTEDGKVLDSTQLRNRATYFPYDRVMPAFADALKRMTEGERRRIWIPGNVANGQWVGSPKGMLIFDVTVAKIMAEDVLEPPKGGEAEKSG